MPVAAGAHVGPYEILAPLGAGGMGEVLRAYDYRLQREVAVKIVKNVSDDPDRQRRFLQEARAAGALNHPNILTVHDVGVENGTPYLVTELVEGEPLRAVLHKSPMALKRALDLAVQIAEGLVAAHDAGIVHRDLKPANIMLTKTGLVKLLDFGLAKQITAKGGAEHDHTQPGVIIGTATYMSPEQARGDAVDVRSDQFSFGLILYEMLTGSAAFDRGSAVSTMAAILNEECRPVEEMNPAVPLPLRWIVERCLAKDREQRYASTTDLLLDLKRVRDRLGELESKPAKREKRRVLHWPYVAAMLVCVLAAGALGWSSWQAREKVDFHNYRLKPLATSGGFEGEPAWSPDGKNIAYTADVGHVRQVFVRNLGSYTAAQITRAAQDCRQPFWSRDGSKVFYLAPDEKDVNSLWVIGASGGGASRLASDVAAAAVADDSTIAMLRPDANEGLALWMSRGSDANAAERFRASGLPHRSFTRGYLAFSPDGKSLGAWVATWSGESEFWVIPRAEGAARRAFAFADGIYPFSWMPDGRRIVFGGVMPGTSGADLHFVDLDSGRFEPITKTTQDAVQPAVSPEGQRIAFTVREHDFDLLELSAEGGGMRQVLASSRNETSPAWSPVGSQLAYATDRTGTSEIWLKSLQDDWERPLITEKDFGRKWISSFSDLAFSTDGQRLAFTISRAGGHSIYLFNSAGGPPIKLTTAQDEERSPSWSADGNWVAYATHAKGSWWLAKTSSGGNGAPALLAQFPAIREVHWSPSGGLIACSTRENLFLVSAEDNQTKLASKGEWLAFDWLKDGSAILGIERRPDGTRVLASLDVHTGLTKELGALDLPSTAEVERLSVAPDKRRMAVAISKPRGDIWMLEGFPGSRTYFQQFWENISAKRSAADASGL